MNASNDPTRSGRVLLTGATGYVGSRLLRTLEGAGRPVRCLVRSASRLSDPGDDTEVIEGDVLDRSSLDAAFEGIDCAFYLVHSMGTTGDFVEQDREAARNFGDAARAAGVRRIVYLGGLGDDHDDLSPHLRSRHEVGEILRESGVDVIELRASIILGAGSLSFDLVRHLVERLPVMVIPRWVRVAAQPIAIRDVIEYLVQSIDLQHDGSRVFEIGGTDVVSYADIMRAYAAERGLRRLMLPLPVLTPRLSSVWLALVTPVYYRVGAKLISSIRHPTVVRDPAARDAFRVQPLGVREAIRAALRNEDRRFALARWNDAVSSTGKPKQYGGVRFGSRLVDSRTRDVDAAPADAFRPIVEIGGKRGWYFGNILWRVRGWMDLLVGGVGMRRGRRDPQRLRVGDTIDCWRVESFEPDRSLRLSAEMRLPGRAWLEFEVTPRDDGGSRIRQTAIFDPVGLFGLCYWYAIYPLHELVFAGMLRRIARAASSAPATKAEARPKPAPEQVA